MQSAAFTVAVFEFVLLIFSLSVHECSHAWVASRLGDQTARMQGRVTLNPMYHVDPIGTLIFPAIAIFGPFVGLQLFAGMLIGWAKPTPVTTRNFRRLVRDENLVTLAGPASNLLLTVVALAVLIVLVHAVPDGRTIVIYTFRGMVLPDINPGVQAVVLLAVAAIEINLSLFFFNLLPIPPLDGSHLVRNMLPYNAVQTYDRIGGGWLSWILMIFVGGYILRALLLPALNFVLFLLAKL